MLINKKTLVPIALLLVGCLQVASAAQVAKKSVLSYESFQRLNTPPSQTSASNNWFSLDLVNTRTQNRWDTHFQGVVKFFHTSQDYQFSIPEAFVQYSSFTHSTSVGRKILDWNQAEDFWGLGHINGRQGLTLIGDKAEGLIGIKHKQKLSDSWDIDLFASPFFLPSMNPGYDFNNGNISSKTEWAQLPPKKTSIYNKSIPIEYRLQRPSNRSIVLQESLGMNVSYNWAGGKISGYSIYKPENTLRNNAEGRLSNDMEKILVDIHPFVNHHLIYGADIKQRIDSWILDTGIYSVDPDGKIQADLRFIDPILLENQNRELSSDYFVIKPSYQKQRYFHASANLDKYILGISMNYLHLLNQVPSGSGFYGDVVRWRKAVGMMVNYDFSDNFSVLLDMKYDLELRDNLLKHEYAYNFWDTMSLAMGLELLKSPEKSSFWNPYRSNDTVYSNLGIAF